LEYTLYKGLFNFNKVLYQPNTFVEPFAMPD